MVVPWPWLLQCLVWWQQLLVVTELQPELLMMMQACWQRLVQAWLQVLQAPWLLGKPAWWLQLWVWRAWWWVVMSELWQQMQMQGGGPLMAWWQGRLERRTQDVLLVWAWLLVRALPLVWALPLGSP